MAIQVPDGVFSFHTQTRTVRSGRYFTAVHHEQAARILKHVQEITVLSFRAFHPVKLATDSRFPLLYLDKLARYLSPGVETPIKLGVRFDRLVLVLVLNIHVSSQVRLVVTANLEHGNLASSLEFRENIPEKFCENFVRINIFVF